MSKKNKTNGNGKRCRFKGKEHVLIPRLAAFGVVRSVRRIDGLGAVPMGSIPEMATGQNIP